VVDGRDVVFPRCGGRSQQEVGKRTDVPLLKVPGHRKISSRMGRETEKKKHFVGKGGIGGQESTNLMPQKEKLSLCF